MRGFLGAGNKPGYFGVKVPCPSPSPLPLQAESSAGREGGLTPPGSTAEGAQCRWRGGGREGGGKSRATKQN